MPGYFDRDRFGFDAGSYGVGFNPDDEFRGPLTRFGGEIPDFAGMRPQRPVNPQVQTPVRLGPSMRILGQRDTRLGLPSPLPGQGQAPVKGATPRVGGVLPANQPTPVVAPTLAPTKKRGSYFGPPRAGVQGSV